MKLTPGIRYLGRWTRLTIFPIVGVFLLLLRALQAFAPGRSLSVGGSIALFLVAVLTVLTTSIVYTKFSRRRRAAALGARLIPRIRGYLPGNLDIAGDFVEKIDTEYIGTPILEQMQLQGYIVNMSFIWEDFIFTAEPQDIKTTLTTDFKSYAKGKIFDEMAKDIVGSGIFNSDGKLSISTFWYLLPDDTVGDLWKFNRTMVHPFLNTKRIGDLDIFDRHADSVIALMKEQFRLGLAVDFQEAIYRFTLESASELLFGHGIDTLSVALSYPYGLSGPERVSKKSQIVLDFMDALQTAQQIMINRRMIGWIWPLFELFQDDTWGPMKVIHAFLEPILKDALAKHRTSQELQDSEGDCLLDHFIRQTTDFKVLRDQTLNMLVAARDTTGSTLMCVIYLLGMYPDVLRRLREEILEKVGPIQRPSYEDMRKMNYLRAVLNETWRLFPVVPVNIRQCVNDTTLQSSNPHKKPFFIPAGTGIAHSILLMQRRTDLWGPDALEFDPDRFLDDRLDKYLTPNPSIFAAFSAGPRMCPGKKFAYNESSFTLIRLLQHFSSITLSPESQDPANRVPAAWAHGQGRQTIEKIHIKHHMSLYAKGGLWVKMEPAEM